MIGIIAQVGIAICGVSAIWLVNAREPRWARWGPVMGLLGQPFWFITTVMNGQWGIVALCFLYTWAWWRGFIKHWGPRKSLATDEPPEVR